MVIFDHTHDPFFGSYAIGVSAVISFFLLSGFVMTALIEKYYFSISSLPAFFIERFLRLAPQFYFYSFLTLIGMHFFGLRHDFMQFEPSTKSIIFQFGLVPLDFYRHFPSMLLPQAWSLGLEATFYAAFPFLLLNGLRFPAAILSMCVYLAAYSGFIDTDLWGYRYLPGTLFIFICGSFLYSAERRKEHLLVLAVFMGAIGLLALTYVVPNTTPLFNLYNRSVLSGLILGIPIVWSLKPLSHESGKGSAIDSMAGNLSYGVYLSHMLIIGIMETYFHIKYENLDFWQGIQMTTSVIFLATCLGYLSFKFLESPMVELRRRGRQRQLTINKRVSGAAEVK